MGAVRWLGSHQIYIGRKQRAITFFARRLSSRLCWSRNTQSALDLMSTRWQLASNLFFAFACKRLEFRSPRSRASVFGLSLSLSRPLRDGAAVSLLRRSALSGKLSYLAGQVLAHRRHFTALRNLVAIEA
jgi:hypothetical protein